MANRRLYWTVLGTAAALCAILAFVQYRWIGEIAVAERDRLRDGLQNALNALSRDFNAEIRASVAALQPHRESVGSGLEEYAARFIQWRDSGVRRDLFKTLAVAVPAGGDLELMIFDATAGKLTEQPWPDKWRDLRQSLQRRLQPRAGPPPMPSSDPFVIELPRFQGGPGGGREREWLLIELSGEYMRQTFLPEMIQRHLEPLGLPGFEAEVSMRQEPTRLIYSTHERDASRADGPADASVALFDAGPGIGPRMGNPMNDPGRGRWQLVVRSHEGSLEALVQRARTRNLAISAGILGLLIASVVLLLRFSAHAQYLADLQMNFVAGVSHEFRTPLTVIRTAAFNLREKVSRNPEKVERYGKLIEDETHRLNALVEQVLQFASARKGSLVRERIPVRVDTVITDGLQSSETVLSAAGCDVETNVEADLPLVLGDESSLKQMVQNLVENAAKYGTAASRWVGVSAERASAKDETLVRIRVSDHGRGIPLEEQRQIFDAFFRGRQAIKDQIHGTGIGLSLVKQIVDAHNGSVYVKSEEEKGTEFVVELPAWNGEKRG